MSDLPKQELDELFREGAGMQKFEYNNAAWIKMDAKLDATDKRRKAILWLLVGLATAVMTSFWYSNVGDTNTAQEVIFATQINSNSSTENLINQTDIIHTEASVAEVMENETTENVVSSESTSSIGISVSEKEANKTNQSNIAHTEATSEVTYATVDNTTKVKEDQSETKANTFLQVSALRQHNISRLTAFSSFLKSSQALIEVISAEYDDKDNDYSIASRLSYTVFIAPEWSSISLDGPMKMGCKFGAKIGFQLTNKFELSAGLSLSQKKFNGEGSNFTEAGGWIDDIMPMTMEAKCNILEIPLDLVYHFNGVGNTGFVASVGLRGYMLHSEWYGFEYDPSQYKPGLIDEKNIPNPTKNWAGSIELSLGFNKKIGNHLSAQIIPYLQIPTTKFGDGKLNLYSSGVQFAVRFDK